MVNRKSIRRKNTKKKRFSRKNKKKVGGGAKQGGEECKFSSFGSECATGNSCQVEGGRETKCLKRGWLGKCAKPEPGKCQPKKTMVEKMEAMKQGVSDNWENMSKSKGKGDICTGSTISQCGSIPPKGVGNENGKLPLPLKCKVVDKNTGQLRKVFSGEQGTCQKDSVIENMKKTATAAAKIIGVKDLYRMKQYAELSPRNHMISLVAFFLSTIKKSTSKTSRVFSNNLIKNFVTMIMPKEAPTWYTDGKMSKTWSFNNSNGMLEHNGMLEPENKNIEKDDSGNDFLTLIRIIGSVQRRDEDSFNNIIGILFDDKWLTELSGGISNTCVISTSDSKIVATILKENIPDEDFQSQSQDTIEDTDKNIKEKELFIKALLFNIKKNNAVLFTTLLGNCASIIVPSMQYIQSIPYTPENGLRLAILKYVSDNSIRSYFDYYSKMGTARRIVGNAGQAVVDGANTVVDGANTAGKAVVDGAKATSKAFGDGKRAFGESLLSKDQQDILKNANQYKGGWGKKKSKRKKKRKKKSVRKKRK